MEIGQLLTIDFEKTGIRINGSTKPRPFTVDCSNLFNHICPFISEFTKSHMLSGQEEGCVVSVALHSSALRPPAVSFLLVKSHLLGRER